MNDQEHRAQLLNKARAIATKAATESRELTTGESDQIAAGLAEIRQLDTLTKADAQ